MVDYPIDESIIVSLCDKNSVSLASKIADFSKKYATNGRLEVILNKSKKENVNSSVELLNSLELDLLGVIEEFDEDETDKIEAKLENLYHRMNLPQIEN